MRRELGGGGRGLIVGGVKFSFPPGFFSGIEGGGGGGNRNIKIVFSRG